jgi:hypothetical protein
MAWNAPSFDSLFGEFRSDFETLPGLTYCSFDRYVFEALVDHYGIRLGRDVTFVDVYSLAREVVYGLSNYKLPTVACSLGIPAETHHDAKCDALQCARVFLKIGGNVDVGAAAGGSMDVIKTFKEMVEDVLADGVVETWEARKLQGFLGCLSMHSRILKAVYAFLDEVLEDGRVSKEESDILAAVLRYALAKLDEGGTGGTCADLDCKVKGHITVEPPEVDVGVPADWRPKAVYIPSKTKEHWEFVSACPFTTITGANVTITGEGVKVTREKAEALVKRLGGNLKGNPVKALDFCVVLGRPVESCKTTKATTAREYQAQGSPVRIIDEDEFLALVRATLEEKPQPEPVPEVKPPEPQAEPEPQGENKGPSFMAAFMEEFPENKVDVPERPPA